MRKYVILFVLTVIGITISLHIPNFAKLTAQKTGVVSTFRRDIKSTVMATGKIEYTESTEVKSSYPLVPEKIYVSEGDYVKKGDILFSVDRSAVSDQISSMKLAAAMAGSKYSDVDINLNAIPERITSPVDGIVTSINATENQLILPDKTTVTISNGNGLQVRAMLSENIISSVKIGQHVEITGNGFRGKTYSGKVAYLANEAKEVLNGTTYETVVEGIISIDNPDSNLKPGYTAKVSIVVEEQDDVLLIPYEALAQDQNNAKYVYKIIGDWAKKTLISTGPETEYGIVVKSGIKEGEQLVVNPQSLRGDCVRIVKQ
ncbi:MAG TPA: efflux RND transporter periplasmic adaptor subunit [Clostridiales bacterium]|nr:efflux RND transporter periplasmic adaptor subunit [Clostridiales bacterium]